MPTVTTERIRCPKCGMPLVEFTFRGIRIDQCAGCEGIWLDADELKQVVRAHPGPNISLELASELGRMEAERADPGPGETLQLRALHLMRCPRCGGGLQEVPFRDLRADHCTRCRGVWLDPGELEQVAGADSGMLKALLRLLHGD